jgi:hypothetical protein
METSLERGRNAPTGEFIQIYDFTLFLTILFGEIDFFFLYKIARLFLGPN